MIESVRVDQWLYGLLSGDATLNGLVNGRIYGYLAPQDAALPFVLYSHQSGVDVRGVGPTRIMVGFIYQVKAVGQGPSFAPLQPIADRIDTLLQGASGSVVDGLVLACVRESTVAFVEVESGVQYRHLGGLWHIIAQ
ncbi:MAG TPA: DUF3168 domain-containing protein [Candidatus Acidoferrales bacterium]|nr:DUF3168 domain-containing protein [Candidatus Acidoferrales bacterium]